MYGKFIKTLTWALTILLVTSTVALAAEMASGTIVEVKEEVVIVQGADGQTYEIEAAEVEGLDLKTGDVVEYEIVEGAPLHINKKSGM